MSNAILEHARVLLKMYDIAAVIEDRSDQVIKRWEFDSDFNYGIKSKPKYQKPYVLLYGASRYVRVSKKKHSAYKSTYRHQQFYSTAENLLEGIHKLIKKRSVES